MTLGEVFARLIASGKPPEVGDHEIVQGPDGLAHWVFVTYVDGNRSPPQFGFMCLCMALPQNTDTHVLVIEPVVTCLTCLSKS